MKKIVSTFLLAMMMTAAVPFLAGAQETGKEIAVIAHAKLSPPGGFSAGDAKDVYLGKTAFWGNAKLVPVSSGDKVLYEAFLKRVVSMTPEAYKSYWVKKVFGEGGSAPKSVDKAPDLVRTVSESEGRVGYVWAEDVEKLVSSEPNVKVILKVK